MNSHQHQLQRIVLWFKQENHTETRNHRLYIREKATPEASDYQPTPLERLWTLICQEYPNSTQQQRREVYDAVVAHAMQPYQSPIPTSLPKPVPPIAALVKRTEERKKLKARMKHRR